MKKSFGYLLGLALFVSTAFWGCGDSDSSPTAGDEPAISSGSESPESSEQSLDDSSDSGSSDSGHSISGSSTSSGNASSSSGAGAPNSSVSELQQYEKARPFFDDGWRDECLRLANEYRASENVAPLVLADDDKQLCAKQQAAADMAENAAHGHMDMCGSWAQNSGPNFSTTWRKSASTVVQAYIKMMWEDEKELVTTGERDPAKSEDYSYIGHYLNLRNASYTKLACGIAISEDGTKGWFNMNFY